MAELDYHSPLGMVRLIAKEGRLCQVVPNGPVAVTGRSATTSVSPALSACVALLDGYFAGRPLQCHPRSLSLEGRSAFERAVYEALMRVPFGRIITYGELARLCSRDGAARSVGQALGRNPLPLFVPCHRVVHSHGRLGGFSAGTAWKKRLLRHEGWRIQRSRVQIRDEARSLTELGG